MTQIFTLTAQNSSTTQTIKDGLGKIQGDFEMARDVNDLSDRLKNAPKSKRLIVVDYNWDNGYELTIQDFAKTPTERKEFVSNNHVVMIHGNAAWIASSIKQNYYDQLGVIGFVNVKESFCDYDRVNKESVLGDVLHALLKQINENPTQDITPDMFQKIKDNLPEPVLSNGAKRRLDQAMHPRP